MITGFLLLGNFPELDFFKIIIVIISAILATIINTLIVILIGLFSFKIEDANPIYWVYSKALLILGTLFPVEFFPVGMQGIIRYSPIFVVSYGPAKLFVDFDYKNAIYILLAQIVYLIIIYMICILVYKEGVRKLNVNGG